MSPARDDNSDEEPDVFTLFQDDAILQDLKDVLQASQNQNPFDGVGVTVPVHDHTVVLNPVNVAAAQPEQSENPDEGVSEHLPQVMSPKDRKYWRQRYRGCFCTGRSHTRYRGCFCTGRIHTRHRAGDGRHG